MSAADQMLIDRLRERAASYRQSSESAQHTAAILEEAAAAIARLAEDVRLFTEEHIAWQETREGMNR